MLKINEANFPDKRSESERDGAIGGNTATFL